MLRLLAAGLSDRECAAALHVSVSDVRCHAGNLLDKTGLVIRAIRGGIVVPEDGRGENT